MRRVFIAGSLLALTLGAVFLPARGDEFFFKSGDRIVMMGDSITEQHLYSNYVEMWTVTRFPAWDLTFRNVGIGGDRSIGGNSRFKRDTSPYKPTAMTVDFGMNDGGYRSFDETTFRPYMGGLQGIADQAKAAAIRVAWVTPQPLDNADPGPTALTAYNVTLERFSEGVKTTADKNGGLFVDQFHPYLSVLDRARAAGPSYDRITGGDAVHPGPPGQALMAYGILKGLGFPATVSSVEIVIDSPNLRDLRVRTSNCTIGFPIHSGDNWTFERTDAALPFFPDEARPILKWAPILEGLNQYTLKMVGLKPGKYSIRLGSTAVADFSAEQLGHGVNLADAALQAGPVAEQVKAVKAAVEAKNKYHHDRIFRGVVLAQASIPDWLGVKLSAAEIDRLRKTAFEERIARLPELDAAVRKTLEIRPHTVEVVRVGD
jgi:lysophospholipase L1-like esterase